tara:strand:+ start:731 stop:2032 length:1302 start_codon:yes stop_codon:yes gene_type:complete
MPPVIFSQESLTNPQGKNGLASFAAYYQRLLYKEAIYPASLWKPLDTWYDKQYYGKVDRRQNTIVINENRLSPIIRGAVPNLLAVDFVAEAFDAFAAHMGRTVQLNACDPNGTPLLLNMKAHAGYENPRRIYAEYLNAVYASFLEITPRYTDKIIDFSSFEKAFQEHLVTVSSHIPITLTNYLLTGTIGGFSSGLTIAIANATFDDDNYKYDNFITDPNYAFYVRAAKKFGFIVNKNAPWLLTADLFSDAALHYINKYGTAEQPLNEDNFFETYYTSTYLYDIPLLTQFIVNSYSSFIELNPYYQKHIYKKTTCGTFKVENFLRAPALPNSTNDLFSDKKLSDLYLTLRSNECENPVQITSKLLNELQAIYFALPDPSLTGVENIATYINLIYRDYIYSVDYPALNLNIFLNLDNQVRTGNITTVGSIVRQLY